MKKIFNISVFSKIAQQSNQENDDIPSGGAGSPPTDAPVGDMGSQQPAAKPSISTQAPARSRSPLKDTGAWRAAVEEAKKIYTEHGYNAQTSHLVSETIRKKLDNKMDMKIFDKEMNIFISRKALSNLYTQHADDHGDSNVLKELMQIINEEGPTDGERFVEYTIRHSNPELLQIALNMIASARSGTGRSLESYSTNARNPIQESLNAVNMAAAQALTTEIETGNLSKMIQECVSIMPGLTIHGVTRVEKSIFNLLDKKTPLFSSKDLLGTGGGRSQSFLSYFVAQHSESLRAGGSPLLNNNISNFINSHLQTRLGALSLGSDYSHIKEEKSYEPSERVRQHFDHEDGGLFAYRLPDGKYAFEHISEDFADALSQNPPDRRAMCIVLAKLAIMAPSSGQANTGVSFSSMGDEDRGGVDFSETGRSYSGSPVESKESQEVVVDQDDLKNLISMVRNKVEIIGNAASKVAKYVNDDGNIDNESISQYLTGAIGRLNAHAASMENWIAGHMFVAEATGGISIPWVSNINKIYKETLKNDTNKKIIKQQGNLKDILSSRAKHSDGVESYLMISYEPETSSPDSRIFDQSGRKIVDTKIKAKISDIIFRDKMAESAFHFPSQESLQVAKIINPYIKQGTQYQKNSIDKKVEDLLNVFNEHPEVAVTGSQILKANLSGSAKRIKDMLGIRESSLEEGAEDTEWNYDREVVGWLFSGKNSSPSMQNILDASRLLSPPKALRLLTAISERIGVKFKTSGTMTDSQNKSVTRYIMKAQESGVITDQEKELLGQFIAKPITWTAGLHNLDNIQGPNKIIANEVNSWIKIMARMVM
jgi:hypothetical protein